MGFLVHSTAEDSTHVESLVSAMPEMTTYGIHQGCYIVAVAEAPSDALEDALVRVQGIEGVLTCYVTSLNIEDEQA